MRFKALALVLGAAVLAVSPAAPALAQKVKVPSSSQQSVVGISTERPQTATVVRTSFPDEFADLDAGFHDVYLGKDTPGQKLLATSKILNQFRAKYIKDIRNAPDDLLKLVIQSLADLHSAIDSKESASTCGEFTLNGTGDLFNRQLAAPYMTQLDALTAHYLRAVAAGMAKPTATEPAKPEDWSAIAQLVLKQGTPQSDLDAIVKGDPSNPRMCKAMISLLRAMVDMPGDSGHRLRAELAVSSSLY